MAAQNTGTCGYVSRCRKLIAVSSVQCRTAKLDTYTFFASGRQRECRVQAWRLHLEFCTSWNRAGRRKQRSSWTGLEPPWHCSRRNRLIGSDRHAGTSMQRRWGWDGPLTYPHRFWARARSSCRSLRVVDWTVSFMAVSKQCRQCCFTWNDRPGRYCSVGISWFVRAAVVVLRRARDSCAHVLSAVMEPLFHVKPLRSSSVWFGAASASTVTDPPIARRTDDNDRKLGTQGRRSRRSC